MNQRSHIKPDANTTVDFFIIFDAGNSNEKRSKTRALFQLFHSSLSLAYTQTAHLQKEGLLCMIELPLFYIIKDDIIIFLLNSILLL
jgi:hypothetical protein